MSPETFQPAPGRVLIRRDAVGETYTEGGKILKPDFVKERPARGTVVAVATRGATLETGAVEDMLYAVGDQVLFAAYAGTPLDPEDEDLLVMDQRDLLGRWVS